MTLAGAPTVFIIDDDTDVGESIQDLHFDSPTYPDLSKRAATSFVSPPFLSPSGDPRGGMASRHIRPFRPQSNVPCRLRWREPSWQSQSGAVGRLPFPVYELLRWPQIRPSLASGRPSEQGRNSL